MTTTERRWLTAAADPGRTWLRLAAAAQVLETMFSVVQWAGLAWVAQEVFARHRAPGAPALGTVLAGGVLAAAAAWGGARWQAAGRDRIATAIRQRMVAGLLPSAPRRGDPDPATAALAAVELTDDVADYHADTLPQRRSAPVAMVLIFVVTAAVQWPVAVILLAASLLVPLNLRLAGLFAKEGTDERLVASTRLAAVVLDSFRGLRTLQSIGAVERRRVQLAAAAARLNTTTMVVVRRAFISGSVMEVVITFSIAANATFIGLSLLGYVRVDAAPQVTLFSGLLTLLLCPMYFAPLRGMAAAYHSRERAAAAVPTIMALLADTGPQPVERPAAPVAGPVTVVLDEVGFSFGGSSSPVIQDVNLTIRPGQWTAITGASGAGKTTLLSLIAGAREPTTGSVEWRTPAGELAPQLGGCAWIGQQTAILPGSITDNICIGRPAASPADIAGALAAAGLADVVARLPDGLDTQLGEGGSGLSTGEARRIAIARAFLRDAELWVLDEPTAHLDPEAEARVIDALRAATPGRTVIVATHSVALAGCADTLLTVADASVQPVRDVIAA
jgi:ATP-binding cassette subfamily C protein CydD